jgi:hypothetical protein
MVKFSCEYFFKAFDIAVFLLLARVISTLLLAITSQILRLKNNLLINSRDVVFTGSVTGVTVNNLVLINTTLRYSSWMRFMRRIDIELP